jgi:hypothetical protein
LSQLAAPRRRLGTFGESRTSRVGRAPAPTPARNDATAAPPLSGRDRSLPESPLGGRRERRLPSAPTQPAAHAPPSHSAAERPFSLLSHPFRAIPPLALRHTPPLRRSTVGRGEPRCDGRGRFARDAGRSRKGGRAALLPTHLKSSGNWQGSEVALTMCEMFS